eukprot:GSMAST32.ASY1.ANO1.2191.1 assembled CDS
MENYHVYEELSRADDSISYKARRKKSFDYVTVTSNPKSLLPKIRNAVHLQHTLKHRNVLLFHNWYETRNHIWVVEEYRTGGSYQIMCEQDMNNGGCTEKWTRTLGLDLMAGINYIHRSSVLHCDIKPGNVFFNSYGCLKISGFTLSQNVPLEDDTETSGQRRKEGTPAFMAPELYLTKGIHSYASDIWSFGVLLYMLRFKRKPFESSSLKELIWKIANETPDFTISSEEGSSDSSGNSSTVDVVSSEFRDLMVGMLEKDASRRLTWSQLRTHPFWEGNGIKLIPDPDSDESGGKLPHQPLFDKFVEFLLLENSSKQIDTNISNNIDVKKEESSEEDDALALTGVLPSEISRVLHTMRKSIDVNGLSKAAKRNLNIGISTDSSSKSSDSIDNTTSSGTEKVKDDENISSNEIEEDEELHSGIFTRLNMTDQKTHSNEILIARHSNSNSSNSNDSNSNSFNSNNSNNLIQSGVSETTKDIILNGSDQIVDFSPASIGKRSKNITNLHQRDDGPTLHKSQNMIQQVTEAKVKVQDRLEAKRQYREEVNRRNSIKAEVDKNIEKTTMDMDQLLWCKTDTNVKPIFANRLIGNIPKFKARLSTLPFEPLSSKQVMKLLSSTDGKLEAFFATVYKLLAGKLHVTSKENILSYLSTLISSSKIANLIVNSSLMTLFIKLLKQYDSVTLKRAILFLLGGLVRRAAYITPELCADGLLTALTDLLRHHSIDVRRSAIAAAGELIFYVSIQMDNSSLKPVEVGHWSVGAVHLTRLVQCLKSDDDLIVRHYAAKTVENVLGKKRLRFPRLIENDVVKALLGLCHVSYTDNLRITAAGALCQLLRHNNNHITLTISRGGLKFIMNAIGRKNRFLQQSSLNLLNLCFSQTSTNSKCTNLSSGISSLRKKLLADGKLRVLILRALAQGETEVIQAKAALCISNFVTHRRTVLLNFCCKEGGSNHKLQNVMNRILEPRGIHPQKSKQKITWETKYLKNSMNILLDVVCSSVRSSVTDMKKILLQPTSKLNEALLRSTSDASALLYFAGCGVVRTKMFTSELLSDVGACVFELVKHARNTEGVLSRKSIQSTTDTILLILERLSQQPGMFSGNDKMCEVIMLHLLPSILAMGTAWACVNLNDSENIYEQEEGNGQEILEVCMRLFTRFLTINRNMTSSVTSSVNKYRRKLAVESFLPAFPALLQEAKPVPQYSLRSLENFCLMELQCDSINSTNRKPSQSNIAEALLIAEVDNGIGLLDYISSQLEYPPLSRALLATIRAILNLLPEVGTRDTFISPLVNAICTGVDVGIAGLLLVLLQKSLDTANESDNPINECWRPLYQGRGVSSLIALSFTSSGDKTTVEELRLLGSYCLRKLDSLSKGAVQKGMADALQDYDTAMKTSKYLSAALDAPEIEVRDATLRLLLAAANHVPSEKRSSLLSLGKLRLAVKMEYARDEDTKDISRSLLQLCELRE